MYACVTMNAGHLTAQMVAIVNDLPALIQQTLRYDLESGKLRLDYKRHLDAFDAINKRIYYEREQQSIIQARMSAIKVKQTEVPVTPLSSSTSGINPKYMTSPPHRPYCPRQYPKAHPSLPEPNARGSFSVTICESRESNAKPPEVHPLPLVASVERTVPLQVYTRPITL
ncbi:hypothetical protein K474DRAFT_1440175 [Panus rudis PR-1116 ss-1]|nr:hypothetical protein K474DRAFT_1440175 [Panus rudis PR-1116 ss-1]